MTKAEMEARLEQIEQELIPYNYIMKKLIVNPFSLTEDERKQFLIDNKEDIDKMQVLRREKFDLRWRLMPPEKQKEYIDKYSED